MGVSGGTSGTGGAFPGVQGSINNAIGSNNWMLEGGAGQLAGGAGTGTRTPISIPGTPNPWANVGTMQPIQPGSASGSGNPAGGNPYLQQYYNAAANPMITNFQNTIAPNLLANFAQSGTVGGSGQQQAFNTAENNLAQGLGTLGASIYEPAWGQTQQIAANEAMQTQGLGAQAGLQAQQNAANELMQQRSLASGLYENALGAAPSLASGAYIPSEQMAQSGAQQQTQLQNILNNAYQNLYSQSQYPFQELGMLGQGLGLAQGNAGSQVSLGPGMGGFK